MNNKRETSNPATPLSLGYRALFTLDDIDPDHGLVRVMDIEFRNWARTLVDGPDPLPTWDGKGSVQLADGIVAYAASADGERDGTIRCLYRLDNRTSGRLFRVDTYLIGNQDPTTDQQVMVEGWLETTDQDEAIQEFSTPRIVRNVIGGRRAHAGPTRVTAKPRPVMRGEEEFVTGQIHDPERTIPITVAVSPASEANQRWGQLVDNLVRNSMGMALTYTVPFEAAQDLNELLPDDLQVPPGTARTFLPDIDLENPNESLRHRSIGARALADAAFSRRGETTVRHFLRKAHARSARRSALARPLPKEARRTVALTNEALAKAHLAQRVEQQVAQKTEAAFPAVPATAPIPVEEIPAEQIPAEQTSVGKSRSEKVAVEEPQTERTPTEKPQVLPGEVRKLTSLAAIGERILSFLRGRFGAKAAELDPVAEIQQTYQSLDEKKTEVDALWDEYGRESAQLEKKVRALEEASAAQQAKHQELQLDLAAEQIDAANLQRKLDYYRSQLLKLKETDLLDPVLDGDWGSPTDIDELVDRLTPAARNAGRENHPVSLRVVYTGNREDLEPIAKADIGGWAAKIWTYIHALHDYAELKAAGGFEGGFQQYLENDLASGAKTALRNYAQTESESVKENPKWREQRVFPVPTSVVPAGRVFMGSHFKIRTETGLYPRIYFHDATAKDGKIYVGYIGKHLTNTLTN